MSALPPKADIAGKQLDVRFVPIPEVTDLFDDFVGGDQKSRRYGEAEHLCRFQVERRFKLCRRLYRKVCGLGATQDTVDIRRRLPINENEIGAVRHETARCDEKAEGINSR
jgi:hypothetical protein